MLLAALKLYIEPVDWCFNFLRGCDTVNIEQKAYHSRPVSDFKSSVQIINPLNVINVLVLGGVVVSYFSVDGSEKNGD